ncbi:MAG: hypothetical protein DMF78_18685 [Acidobacteria bacterium]|nr:MAG: hypothetical protein DMF78_18685 [Acidobacteriota bacterium]
MERAKRAARVGWSARSASAKKLSAAATYSRSRAVGGPGDFAFCTSARPRASSAGLGAAVGFAAAQTGWKSDIAMPQCAIAHDGSAASTPEKAPSASS